MRPNLIVVVATIALLAIGDALSARSSSRFMRSTTSVQQDGSASRTLQEGTESETESDERGNGILGKFKALFARKSDALVVPKLPQLQVKHKKGDKRWVSLEALTAWIEEMNKKYPVDPFKEMTKTLVGKIGVVNFATIVVQSKDNADLQNKFKEEIIQIWSGDKMSANDVYKELKLDKVILKEGLQHLNLFPLWIDYVNTLSRSSNDSVDQLISESFAEYPLDNLGKVWDAVENANDEIIPTLVRDQIEKILLERNLKILDESANETMKKLTQKYSQYSQHFIQDREFVALVDKWKRAGMKTEELNVIVQKHMNFPVFVELMYDGSRNAKLDTHSYAKESLQLVFNSWKDKKKSLAQVFRELEIMKLRYYSQENIKSIAVWFKFVDSTKTDHAEVGETLYNVFKDNRFTDIDILRALKVYDSGNQKNWITTDIRKSVQRSFENENKNAEEVFEYLGLSSVQTLMDLPRDSMYKVWRLYLSFKHPLDEDKQMCRIVNDKLSSKVSVEALNACRNSEQSEELRDFANEYLMGWIKILRDEEGVTDEVAFRRMKLKPEKNLVGQPLDDIWIKYMELKHSTDSSKKIQELLDKLYSTGDLKKMWDSVQKQVTMQNYPRQRYAIKLREVLLLHYSKKYRSIQDLFKSLELHTVDDVIIVKNDSTISLIKEYMKMQHSSNSGQPEVMDESNKSLEAFFFSASSQVFGIRQLTITMAYIKYDVKGFARSKDISSEKYIDDRCKQWLKMQYKLWSNEKKAPEWIENLLQNPVRDTDATNNINYYSVENVKYVVNHYKTFLHQSKTIKALTTGH